LRQPSEKYITITIQMKKSAQRDANTARCCSKVEPKIFAPPQTPFPGMQDGQNLISWRWSLTQFGEDRCTQFRVIVVTDPQTHTHTHTQKQTHRQDRLQYTVPLSLARSVNSHYWLKYSHVTCNRNNCVRVNHYWPKFRIILLSDMNIDYFSMLMLGTVSRIGCMKCWVIKWN